MTIVYYSTVPQESNAFMNKALKKFTGEKADFTILRSENNKPYVLNENLHFSLSHTQGLIVCVVSNSSAGIDAEKIREIRNKEKIISRFLKKEPKENMSDTEFLKEWTKFEALLKYNGGTIFNAGEVNSNINVTCIETDGYVITVCSEEEIIKKEKLI